MKTASDYGVPIIQKAWRDFCERCRPLYDLRVRVDMLVPVDLVLSDDGTLTQDPRPSEQQADLLRRIDEMIAREREATMDKLKATIGYYWASFDELLPNLVGATIGVDLAKSGDSVSVAYIATIDKRGEVTILDETPKGGG